MLEVKSGAVFIGDSHENTNKCHFLEFLKAVNSAKIRPSQIFFMGDMFDYLSFTEYAREFYKEQIWLINEISSKIPCFYFEGNHDFNLKEIFPKVKVFGIFEQPVKFRLENEEICQLAHGDRFMPKFDFKVLMILRNRAFLKVMNFLDRLFKFRISKAILHSQENKILYKKHPNFKELIRKKLHNYSAKFIIEGHYHQDDVFEFEVFDGAEKRCVKYINLNSFAVEQKIYKVKFTDGEFKLFGINLSEI